MPDLSALLARLEALTEADRETGNDVLLAFGWRIDEIDYGGGNRASTWVSPDDEVFLDGDQPNLLASLDATLVLMKAALPEASWTLEPKMAWVRVLTADGVVEFEGTKFTVEDEAAATAVALLIALVRAKMEGSP